MSIQRTVTRIIGLVGLLVLGAAFSGACGGGEEEPRPTASPAAEPTATATPLPTEGAQTPSQHDETPSVQPTIRILGPAQDEAVPMIITVEFESPEFAHVLVRPIPRDPNQDYWVQARAVSMGANRWDWESYPVYVGQETDPSGLPFKVCVVITDETLSRGERLRQLPDGPSHCVDVTRE